MGEYSGCQRLSCVKNGSSPQLWGPPKAKPGNFVVVDDDHFKTIKMSA